MSAGWALLHAVSFVQELRDYFQRFRLCRLQIIVHNHGIELRCKAQFVFGFRHTTLYHFGSIRGTAYQSLAQLLHRRRLDEYGQSTLTVEFLDVATAYDIHIEHDILSCGKLFLYLRLQRAVKTVLIDLFILQEFIIGNASAEFVGSQEEVLYPIFLRSAGGRLVAEMEKARFRFCVNR